MVEGTLVFRVSAQEGVSPRSRRSLISHPGWEVHHCILERYVSRAWLARCAISKELLSRPSPRGTWPTQTKDSFWRKDGKSILACECKSLMILMFVRSPPPSPHYIYKTPPSEYLGHTWVSLSPPLPRTQTYIWCAFASCVRVRARHHDHVPSSARTHICMCESVCVRVGLLPHPSVTIAHFDQKKCNPPGVSLYKNV